MIRQAPAPMSHEAAGHILSDRYAVHSTGAGGLAIFGITATHGRQSNPGRPSPAAGHGRRIDPGWARASSFLPPSLGERFA
jgi:hypothetical protein